MCGAGTSLVLVEMYFKTSEFSILSSILRLLKAGII